MDSRQAAVVELFRALDVREVEERSQHDVLGNTIGSSSAPRGDV